MGCNGRTEAAGATEILLLPMFPQYQLTTASYSILREVAAKKWVKPPKLHFVEDLFQEPAFPQAWASLIQQHVDIESLDHIIFSYHGVPENDQKPIPREFANLGHAAIQ